jgi:hypothetical protein
MAAKDVYGSVRTWDEYYFSYAVDHAGRACLVRHATADDADHECGRMKMGNNFRTVGRTTRKVDELTIRQSCRSRGWKITVIR